MRLIDAEQYRREFLNSRDFEPMKILDFQPTVQAIPLAKVKQAREEIRKLDDINPDYPMDRTIHVSRNEVLAILDKLIAESEEQHG